MCDDRTLEETEKFLLTRRQLGLAAGIGSAASWLPSIANATDLVESDVEITTPDGVCDAYFVHPAKPLAE